MRWLSPPDRVPEFRFRVRYSSPTSLRKPSRSLISRRMRWAISLCLSDRWLSSSRNQAPALAIDISVVSLMCLPLILTASASGFRRAPPQASQTEVT